MTDIATGGPTRSPRPDDTPSVVAIRDHTDRPLDRPLRRPDEDPSDRSHTRGGEESTWGE